MKQELEDSRVNTATITKIKNNNEMIESKNLQGNIAPLY